MPAHNEELDLTSAVFRYAAIVLVAVRISPAQPKELKTWHVEIEALGQANPKSHGDEVWIYEVRTPQQVLDWKDIEQAGPAQWEFRPRPNASGGRAALAMGSGSRTFRAVVHGDFVSVKMVKHAWSGRVRITVNGDARTLDLYSAAEPDLVTEHFDASQKTQPVGRRDGDSQPSRRPALLVGVALFAFLLIWTIWRRSGNAGGLVTRNNDRDSWLRNLSHRALIASLLAIPAALPLAHVIFGAPGVEPRPLEFVLAFLYCFGSFFGILTLWLLCKSPAANRTKTAGNGRRAYWATAAGVSAVAATLLVAVGEDGLNKQHAYWVKILIQTTSSQPPPLSIRYGNLSDDVAKFYWQPFSQAILTIKRLSAKASNAPVRIDQISSDGEPTDMDDVMVHGGIRYQGVITLAAPNGGMLRWPRLARKVSIRISGDVEPVRIYWLDQKRDIEVGPTPQTVAFDLGGTYQGWALLPPHEINSLSIESSVVQNATSVIGGDVFAEPEQPLQLKRAQPVSLAANRIAWPEFSPINVRRPGALAMAWLCLFATGMLAVFCLFHLSSYLGRQRWFGIAQRMAAGSGMQPSEHLGEFFRVALPVWGICILYHLAFVFSVSVGFTNDSVGYYDMGRQFIRSPFLQGIVTERTPGYPLFIAAVIWMFGDTVWAIALLQNLALATLSLIVIWCLWDRLPRRWAAVAGLVAGIAPAVTPMANLVWTEALYCTFACSSVLFAFCYRRHPAYVFLAGLCAGAATMVRPNGLLLMAAIAGFLLLHFFWWRGERPVRSYVAAALMLGGGYLMTAAPWHMHLAVNRHTMVLGKGLKEFGSWAGYVFQRQLPIELPVNRPDRAIYADPGVYRDEPYIAQAEFPLIMGDETTYYRETEREWFASQPLGPYLEDLKYNATLVWRPAELKFEFKEIRWFIEAWKQQDTRVTASGSETQRLITELANRKPRALEFLRRPCLAVSEFVLNHWLYLALCSGLGMLASVVCPWLLPVAMFIAASVITFSTNLIPGERYIVVMEPLYYILSVAGAFVFWTFARITVRRWTARIRDVRVPMS